MDTDSRINKTAYKLFKNIKGIVLYSDTELLSLVLAMNMIIIDPVILYVFGFMYLSWLPVLVGSFGLYSVGTLCIRKSETWATIATGMSIYLLIHGYRNNVLWYELGVLSIQLTLMTFVRWRLTAEKWHRKFRNNRQRDVQ